MKNYELPCWKTGQLGFREGKSLGGKAGGCSWCPRGQCRNSFKSEAVKFSVAIEFGKVQVVNSPKESFGKIRGMCYMLKFVFLQNYVLTSSSPIGLCIVIQVRWGHKGRGSVPFHRGHTRGHTASHSFSLLWVCGHLGVNQLVEDAPSTLPFLLSFPFSLSPLLVWGNL